MLIQAISLAFLIGLLVATVAIKKRKKDPVPVHSSEEFDPEEDEDLGVEYVPQPQSFLLTEEDLKGSSEGDLVQSLINYVLMNGKDANTTLIEEYLAKNFDGMKIPGEKNVVPLPVKKKPALRLIEGGKKDETEVADLTPEPA